MGPSITTSGKIGFKPVASDLSFPTGLTFGADQALYVAESGLDWAGGPDDGRVWKLASEHERTLVTEGLRAPVNGIVWHEGALYVSEGGHPGRISRVRPNGDRETVLDDLPGPGNYHTNMGVFGPDGKLYFSQGAMTNTGIVGLDAYELGWLRHLPHQHDLPGFEIELAGVNATTSDPFAEGDDAQTTTGAFVPFGTETHEGQMVEAQLPCTAAVMRCNPDGSDLELVAWGLRNAYGLGFLPDGRLLAIDQGADDRGSRPVGNAPDLLFEVTKGRWYGWPDFVGADPITAPKFTPSTGSQPEFVINNHSDLPSPEKPLARFPTHSAATKFTALPKNHPRWPGHLIVTLFGDERPMTAPEGPEKGRSLMRVDTNDWTCHRLPSLGLNRPIDVEVEPGGKDLYILDFGIFEMKETEGVQVEAETGRILRGTL